MSDDPNPSEALLEALLESTPDLIYFKDRQRQWVRASRSFERLFHRPIEEILGKRDEELFPPEIVEGAIEDDKNVISNGASIVDRVEGGEVTEGKESWVSTTKVPWKNSEGEIVGLLGISRDISNSKRKFDLLYEELEHASRLESLGRIAGSVAHDFNNLLMVIQTATEELSRDLSTERAPRALDRVKSASTQAQLMVRQLLSYTSPPVERPNTSDLNACVRSALGLLKRALTPEIVVHTSLLEPGGTIALPPSRAEQIVLNLALNARAAMPEGGTLTISTQKSQLNGKPACVLEVRDTGVGIEPGQCQRIFEPFYTGNEKGLRIGLGLAAVKAFVEEAKPPGEIQVESSLGHGTTIRIWLPAQQKAEETSLEGGAHLPDSVLMIDDNVLVLESVARTIERLGCRVYAATCIAEAKKALQSADEPIEVLVTDVYLGNESGIQAARALQKLSPELKVLFVSGYPGDELPEELNLNPEFRFLAKPFDQETLRRVLREIAGAP